jgi:hypothetical protein
MVKIGKLFFYAAGKMAESFVFLVMIGLFLGMDYSFFRDPGGDKKILPE